MKAKVSISEYKSDSAPDLHFQVTWPNPVPGKPRKRKRFKTDIAAKDFANVKQVELFNAGVRGASLREPAIQEALWALEQLRPHDVTLRDVVTAYLKSRASVHKSIPVADAVVELLAAKRADGLSPRYVADLKARLGRFAADFGERALAEITTAEIAGWLRSMKVAGETRNSMRRHLVVLYSWAIEAGFAESNPAAAAKKAKVPKNRKVEIFTPEEARVIMLAAPDELKPYFALGLFGGIRSKEIERLDWQAVDFLRGHIEIDAATSKTASHRHVTLNPTLRAWLEPFAKPRGPIRPPHCKVRLQDFRGELAKATGDRPAVQWKNNGPRHSFGSYLLAKERDAGIVASEMGHTTPATTYKHYRARVDAATATAYFDVLPRNAQAGESIVELNARTA